MRGMTKKIREAVDVFDCAHFAKRGFSLEPCFSHTGFPNALFPHMRFDYIILASFLHFFLQDITWMSCELREIFI